MWMSICLQVCLCTVYILGAHGDQKRVSDFLELELQIVVSHHAMLVLEIEPGPWEEQSVPLTAVPTMDSPWLLILKPIALSPCFFLQT